ncbi:MAG TPA: protein kinase [Pirellulaceae bacterium]|nr:protein kinase [Pirellulaceae bacterium]
MTDRLATVEVDDRPSEDATQAEPSPAQRGGTMKFQYATGSRPLEGYTIKRGIGRGGFGEVYFATSEAGKEVALKHIERNLEVELRGVKQCLNLKHPNLIDLYDIRNDDQGEAWVVMEYVAGYSLKDALDRNPNGLPREEVDQWFRGIASGVQYLHDHGIVHRDLKPGNIFDDGGIVKIGDYGLSKFISCSRRSGQTESVGTFHYMAPEIGKGVYGKEIDTYALGIILYEVLTGRVPFEGESSQEIIMKHLTADPDLSAVPAPYRNIIQKAMQKDPEQRFRSVTEMVAILDGAASGKSPALPPAAGGAPPVRVQQQFPAEPDRIASPPEEPFYIGDEMEGISFGPVKEVPAKQAPKSRPPVPGSFAALGAAPRTEEPIAASAKKAWGGFANWWNHGAGGTPLKVAILIAAATAAIFAGPYLLPVIVALALVYLVYLGIWLLVQASSAPSAEQVAEQQTRGRRALPRHITWEQEYRGALRMKTVGDRVGELAGSMLVASFVSSIVTALAVMLGGETIDNGGHSFSGAAWLWMATTLGSWLLLAAGKLWEPRQGEGVKRRFVQLVIGLAFGGILLAGQQYLISNIAPDWQAAAFPLYFAAVFATLGWWKQTDPLRTSRLRILAVLTALIASGLWLAPGIGLKLVGEPFDGGRFPWPLVVPALVSVVVQLSAPWMSPQERAEIRQRVLQGGRV